MPESQTIDPKLDLDALAESAFTALGGGLKREVCCGVGAYGAVWTASDAIGRRVAVKVVFKDERGAWKREYAGVKYFCAHVKNAHAALLFVYHVIEQPHFICYSMEAADSRWDEGVGYEPDTLASRLLKGALPLETVHTYGAELMEAVRTLHETGLIHRDLKPENIFFVDGRIKIGDIGLVSVIRGDVSLVGTPGYMPGADTVDEVGRDIYALGKVLYRMMSGYSVAHFPMMPTDLPDHPLFAPLNAAVMAACDPCPDGQFKTIAELQVAWQKIRMRRRDYRPLLLMALLPLLLLGVSHLFRENTQSDVDLLDAPASHRNVSSTGALPLFTAGGLEWRFAPDGFDSLLIDFHGVPVSPGSVLTMTVARSAPLACTLLLYRSEHFKKLPPYIPESEAIHTLARFSVTDLVFSVTVPSELGTFDRLAVLYDSLPAEAEASASALLIQSLTLRVIPL